MTKAEAVIALLEAQIVRLSKLEGEDIGGFVFVLPPEGDAIAYMTLDAQAEPMTFFDSLNNKLKLYMQNAQLGGVNVPGLPRRNF